MTTHATDSEPIVCTLEHRKVTRRNQLNLKALKVHQDLKEILTPYIGKKIRKTSNGGGWIKALDRSMVNYWEENFRYQRGESEKPFFRLHTHWDRLALDRKTLSISQHGAWIHCSLDTTYQVSDSAVNYLKAHFALGKCDVNGTLIELFDVEERRADYTVDEIEQVKRDIKELKETLREKESFLQGLNN